LQVDTKAQRLIFLTDKEREQSTLSHYGSRVSPDVNLLQRRLGCVVEGVERDQILVRFTKIDKSDPEREFGFVLDVSGPTYRGLSVPALNFGH